MPDSGVPATERKHPELKVRPYQAADLEVLKGMHAAQGFPYPFPNLENPIFLSTLVVESDGRPMMASALRLTSEVYLLHEPQIGTPHERLRCLLALHRAAEMDAYNRGLQDVHCWLPPKIAKSFGRRLLRLGWVQPLWTCFAKTLKSY